MTAEDLPPKTCTIDRMITRDDDIALVLAGKKRVTRRNGRYADVGEEVQWGDRRFRVTRVYSQALGEMTDADAQAEGYPDMAGYQAYITGMHVGMPWMPKARVWVHEFEPVQG